MKKLLANAATYGSAAAIVLGTLYLAVSSRDGAVESAQVLPQRQLVAYLIARDGYLPPTGQCWPVEVALLGDEDDAGKPVATQTVWAVCDVDDGTWETTSEGKRTSAVDAEKRCRARARDLCWGDAGEPESPADRRCAREAEQACLDALRSAGGPMWHGPARPAIAGDVALKRLPKRSAMDQSCGCASRVDAGVCRERIGGADAAPFYRVVQPGAHCGLGLCQGPGCVPAPCEESEARERCGGPGCLDPVECRP